MRPTVPVVKHPLETEADILQPPMPDGEETSMNAFTDIRVVRQSLTSQSVLKR
jgi:hypothetical protein